MGRTNACESGEVQDVGRCGEFYVGELECCQMMGSEGFKAGVRQVQE
jgi:hypothetical protein